MHKQVETRNWRSSLTRSVMAMLFATVVTVALQIPSYAATSATLSWSAVPDTTVTGYKVYYQADSSTQPFTGTGATQGASGFKVGNLTSASLSGLDPARNYYVAVTAYNASGAESSYSNVATIKESVAPTAAITAPAPSSTATGTVNINATATDNIGVTKVEFYVNGTLAATDTATPYLYSWNTSALTPGTYTLMVKAYDAAGNVGSASEAVTVANDTAAPTVSLTAPSTGASLTGTATLSASATDNIGVTKVEFYANGTLLTATNVAPYGYTWNTSAVANGSYTITAKAYDAAGNIGTSSGATVSVANAVKTSYTLWPATTVPSVVDAGADRGVELGVRFTSDVSGYITGIRFYKASTNSGTHVGNLWSATGTKLASATFTNETASGWQQVTFPAPVAISANTVYVASYYCPAGHYSDNQGYFATTYNSVPLHAAADSSTAFNGVYAYNTVSSFPNMRGYATNYWVDVAFSTVAPLTISTQTLPAATQGVAYSSAVTAVNGSAPYTWSLTGGALPAGLTLGSSTGTISGTPSAAGTYSVTIQATDSSATRQSATKTFSITVGSAATYSLWSGSKVPTVADSGDARSVELGVRFRSDVSGYIKGIRFYKSAANTGVHTGTLWTSAGTKLASATFSGETASGWQQVNFAAPVAVSANTVYVASYHAPVGHYSNDQNAFGTDVNSGVLHAPADSSTSFNGVYAYGTATSLYPNLRGWSSNYYVDVVFQ